MPKEPRIYSSFFKDKTIQRTDKFLVTIDPPIQVFNGANSVEVQQIVNAMNDRSGKMPEIKQHQVDNVTIPTWEFKKESVGWSSFPVFEHQGFEFGILFEEDSKGTIHKFVNWLQRRIVDDGGFHFPTRYNRLGSVKIEVLTDHDVTICVHEYTNVYFLRVPPLAYDYNSTTPQKISITFGSENHVFYVNDDLEKDIENRTRVIPSVPFITNT